MPKTTSPEQRSRYFHWPSKQEQLKSHIASGYKIGAVDGDWNSTLKICKKYNIDHDDLVVIRGEKVSLPIWPIRDATPLCMFRVVYNIGGRIASIYRYDDDSEAGTDKQYIRYSYYGRVGERWFRNQTIISTEEAQSLLSEVDRDIFNKMNFDSDLFKQKPKKASVSE